MDLVRIHECLCDRTRLRLVHLLTRGPLCVGQLQAVLRVPQARISRHLAYLRRGGMVEAERDGKRVFYRLPGQRPPLLETNLACLQDCAGEEAVFRHDLRRLSDILRPSPGRRAAAL